MYIHGRENGGEGLGMDIQLGRQAAIVQLSAQPEMPLADSESHALVLGTGKRLAMHVVCCMHRF
jgi:hypothetical protein